jgi:nucleotide-binding universal stress UspA family protein
MTRYSRILVPTDGSSNTNPAITYALDLAKVSGAEITAMCVYDMSNYASTPDAFPDVESPRYKVSEDAVKYVAELGNSMGVKVKPLVVSGIPASDIVEASKDYDLVIMGTVGRTGLAHLLLGSVAGKVIRFASCPVLVVNGIENAKLGGVNCRRILIPTDGSDATKPAIHQGLELAKRFDAAVTALNVSDVRNVPAPVREFGKLDECLLDDSHKAVDYVVEEGKKLGVEVRPMIVTGSPAHEIVKAAAGHDLIVMGTLGRTGLAYVRIGSVAERTVQHAKCPVLVVRAAASTH